MRVETITLRFLLTLLAKSTLGCLLCFTVCDYLWGPFFFEFTSSIWLDLKLWSPEFASHEFDFVWFKLFKSFSISCLCSFQIFDLWYFSTLWLLDVLGLLSSFVDSFEFFKSWLVHCYVVTFHMIKSLTRLLWLVYF